MTTTELVALKGTPALLREEPKMESPVKPAGYRILVAVPKEDEQTEGGIIKPEQLRSREEAATIVAFVVELGPDCYKPTATRKWPSGAWCNKHDWVIFRSYSGTRFRLGDTEFRLINDDAVEAVVDDPRRIRRVA